jgi:hypothetical protein
MARSQIIQMTCDRCDATEMVPVDHGGAIQRWTSLEVPPENELERPYRKSPKKSAGIARDVCPACASAFWDWWERPSKVEQAVNADAPPPPPPDVPAPPEASKPKTRRRDQTLPA